MPGSPAPGAGGTLPSPGHPGRARLIPAVLRICPTVDLATVMPSPGSSPWIRRYPHDSFSRASRSTTDRTLRCVAGRQERLRRDSLAHRNSRAADRSTGRPIRPRQPRMSPWLLALGDSQLVAQDQDLGVFHHTSR